MIDVKQSLAHTTWNCKYHIVFAPKYRRKVFYKEKRREVGKILRTLCEWKKVKILEAEVCPDHVHMLLEIPPKVSVSSFMGYLKGKSSLMIYEKYPELKYKYRNREFWCRGYYVMSTEQTPVFFAAPKYPAMLSKLAKGRTESYGDSARGPTWQSHEQRFPAALQ